RLMDEFYGSRPERSAEGAASPTLREAPFPKDLSPFGPAPDVNVRAIFTKTLWRLFLYGENKNLPLNWNALSKQY
ncbi:MAG: hypothetical protein WA821_13865, partial [Anaerolineales bacterium]